jgi:hypothetical protein
MIAGRRIKTVAFVTILAVTTFGALATASAQQQAFPTAETQQSLAKAPRPAAAPPSARPGVLSVQPAARVAAAFAAVSWTPAVALRHVANLAVAARKGIEPAPLLAHEAFEVAQWASQSSAAAAIQLVSTRSALRPVVKYYTLEGIDDLHEWGLDRLRRQPLTAEEVQMLLGPDEALVFFLVGANESYVFALTREGFEWRTISLGEKNVSARVAAFRRGLDVDELTKSVDARTPELFDLATAHEFYLALLGPVEALIKDKPQLLIVPTGPLTARLCEVWYSSHPLQLETQ